MNYTSRLTTPKLSKTLIAAFSLILLTGLGAAQTITLDEGDTVTITGDKLENAGAIDDQTAVGDLNTDFHSGSGFVENGLNIDLEGESSVPPGFNAGSAEFYPYFNIKLENPVDSNDGTEDISKAQIIYQGDGSGVSTEDYGENFPDGDWQLYFYDADGNWEGTLQEPNTHTAKNIGIIFNAGIAKFIENNNNGASVESTNLGLYAVNEQKVNSVNISDTAIDLDALGQDQTSVSIGDEYYTSIQSAVDNAESGDTIEVEDGTYEVTDRINVDKSVTIKSAGSDRPVINNTDSGWAALKVTADDVTLESLKFVNLNNTDAERVRGLHGNRDSDGLTVKDVVVDGVDGEVPQTDFERSTAFGMTLLGNSTNVVNSEIKDVAGQKFAAGIRLGGNSSLKVEGGTIDNVDVSGIEETGQGTDSVGIFLASISSGGETVVKDSQVSGLTATDGSSGIYLISQNPKAVTPDVNIKSNDLTVSGGTQGSSGIYVEDSAFTDLSQVVVSDNDFSGSDAGAANVDTEDTLDASGNYWGSAAGPQDSGNTYNKGSQGVRVGDNVDFTPWLDAAGGSNFAPVENTDKGTGYASIQAAVDAAESESEVIVKSGRYDESLTIGKEGLLLTSIGPENAVIESANGPVVQLNAPNIEFSGFNITGADGSGVSGQGIDVNGDSFDTDNVVLSDLVVKENDDRGLVVDYSNNTMIRDVKVMNNYDSEENGGDTPEDGWESDDDADGITIYYSNNTVLQDVDVVNNGDNGVYLKGNNHSVTNLRAVNNGDEGLDISSDGSFGDSPVKGGANVEDLRAIDNSAQGVEIESSEELTSIEDATIKGSPQGLFVASDNGAEVRIRESSFYGNEKGLVNDQSEVVDATDNYWGAASGPSGEGDGNGASVSENVDFSPWLLEAEGTEYDETYSLVEGINGWSALSLPSDVSNVELAGEGIVLEYQGGWTSVDSIEESPLSAYFFHENNTALGFDRAEVESGSTREVVTGEDTEDKWNFVGAFNNEPQTFAQFSTVRSAIDAVSYSGYNIDQEGNQVAPGISDYETEQDKETSVYGGYWIKASDGATLETEVPQAPIPEEPAEQ